MTTQENKNTPSANMLESASEYLGRSLKEAEYAHQAMLESGECSEEMISEITRIRGGMAYLKLKVGHRKCRAISRETPISIAENQTPAYIAECQAKANSHVDGVVEVEQRGDSIQITSRSAVSIMALIRDDSIIGYAIWSARINGFIRGSREKPLNWIEAINAEFNVPYAG